jgi:hypothetical protein
MRRFIPYRRPNLRVSSADATPKPLLFPLAYANKQLRKEYLTYLFANLRVGVRWINVAQFVRDMCCTVIDGKRVILVPKEITILIDNHVVGVSNMQTDRMPAFPPLDLLPLLTLRLVCPAAVIIFAPDETADWTGLRISFADTKAGIDHGITSSAGQNLGRLMAFNSTVWDALVKSKKLRKVLVHPSYKHTTWPKVKLIFKEQPPGSVDLSKEAVRCCLPNIRRFGLTDVYYNTDLVFTMSLVPGRA